MNVQNFRYIPEKGSTVDKPLRDLSRNCKFFLTKFVNGEYTLKWVFYFNWHLIIWEVFVGWGSKFGMAECRTTNISEFQNYEY